MPEGSESQEVILTIERVRRLSDDFATFRVEASNERDGLQKQIDALKEDAAATKRALFAGRVVFITLSTIGAFLGWVIAQTNGIAAALRSVGKS